METQDANERLDKAAKEIEEANRAVANAKPNLPSNRLSPYLGGKEEPQDEGNQGTRGDTKPTVPALEKEIFALRERGDLLEKMVFNGVNILVVSILGLAGAGLFFRNLDSDKLEKKATDITASGKQLMDELKGETVGKVNVLQQSVATLSGEVATTKGAIQAITTDSQQFVTRLRTIEIMTDRFRFQAITAMTREYERFLLNATMQSCDQVAVEDIRDNGSLIGDIRSSLAQSPRWNEIAQILDFLGKIHECCVGYEQLVNRNTSPIVLAKTVQDAAVFDAQNTIEPYRSSFAKLPAYLANLLGMIQLHQYLSTAISSRDASILNSADFQFTKGQQVAEFARPYSNRVIVILERARLSQDAPTSQGAGKTTNPTDEWKRRNTATEEALKMLGEAPKFQQSERVLAVLSNNESHVYLERAMCLFEISAHSPTDQRAEILKSALEAIDFAERKSKELIFHPSSTPTFLMTLAEIKCVKLAIMRATGTELSKGQATKDFGEILSLIRNSHKYGFRPHAPLSVGNFHDVFPYLKYVLFLSDILGQDVESLLKEAAGVAKG